MIGYIPKIMQDELFYSWLSRIYMYSGFPAYSYALEEILEKKNMRPTFEFLNRMNPETLCLMEREVISLEELILEHTMFPESRFAPMDRRQNALTMMKSQEGDPYNLLPRPQKNIQRFFRYCPMCVIEDREKYGETFWRREAQIIGVNVCVKHNCRLNDTSIEVTGKQSPRLYIADEEINDVVVDVVDNPLELELSSYMADVFSKPVDFNNDIPVGTFLNSRLEGTEYISVRGKQRNITKLYEDFMEFYKSLPQQGVTELFQLQKIFTGYSYDFYWICQLAFFLKVPANDLVSPQLPQKSQTERFNERVAELYKNGLGCHRIAREMGACASTVLNANRKKKRKAHDYSVRKGTTKNDWELMDKQLLPSVKNKCKEIYHNNGDKPGRVTINAVRLALELPDKRFDYLPKCKKVIEKYHEDYPVYWARLIVWTYRYLIKQDPQKRILYSNIRSITNLRMKNFQAALPYLEIFASNGEAEKIKELV